MKGYLEFISEYAENYGSYKITAQKLVYYAAYLLANFCMPTLLRLKPSSLIRVNKSSVRDARDLLSIISDEIQPFGCSCFVLYENASTLILLIYCGELLNRVLSGPEEGQFLRRLGYELNGDITAQTIVRLKHRYRLYEESNGPVISDIMKQREYPHEIGLILGFPIWDVEDFIRFQGRNYLICGYWKVYHNAEDALKIFESYRSVREYAVRELIAGQRLKDIRKI